MSDSTPPHRFRSDGSPHANRRGPRHPIRPQHKGPKPPEDPLVQTLLRLAEETSALLGPALPAEFYRTVFGGLLQRHSIPHQCQPLTILRHRDQIADRFSCDFLCGGTALVNIHSTAAGEFSHDEIAAAAASQKQFNARHALLLDFSREEPSHRRLAQAPDSFPSVSQEQMTRGIPVDKADEPRIALLCRSLLRIGRAHGLGYAEKSYLGLLMAEFAADSLDCRLEPVVTFSAAGHTFGEIKLRHCMEIQRSGVLLVTAQREGIRMLDRAWLHSALLQLHLPWGLVAHFGRRHFEWRWVTLHDRPAK